MGSGTRYTHRRLMDCAICLSTPTAKGKIDCGHVFCFACIKRWTTVRTSCPLCKASFHSITKDCGTKWPVQPVHEPDEAANHQATLEAAHATLQRSEEIHRLFDRAFQLTATVSQGNE